MSDLRELYVYWKVARTDQVAALAQVRAMQAELRSEQPGLQARVLRRADGGTGPLVTLMEVYTAAPGIDAALQARIGALAAERLTRWCVGERHVEVFGPAG